MVASAETTSHTLTASANLVGLELRATPRWIYVAYYPVPTVASVTVNARPTQIVSSVSVQKDSRVPSVRHKSTSALPYHVFTAANASTTSMTMIAKSAPRDFREQTVPPKSTSAHPRLAKTVESAPTSPLHISASANPTFSG